MKIQTPAAATVSARPQRPGPATPAPSVLPGLHTCCSWGTDGPGPSQVSAPTRVHRPCSLSDLSPLQDPVTVRSGVATFPEVLSSDNCHFRASGVLRLAPRVPCAEPWRALFAHITPGPPCSAHLLPPRPHPGSWSGWTAHLRCLHQAAIPSLPPGNRTTTSPSFGQRGSRGRMPSAPAHWLQAGASALSDPMESWESSARTLPVIVLEGLPFSLWGWLNYCDESLEMLGPSHLGAGVGRSLRLKPALTDTKHRARKSHTGIFCDPHLI